MTKVRLVRNDGELLELDCMSYSLNITRSVPVLPVPVFGERYSVDLNMVTADYKLTVMLADDDCASSSFEKKAAVASIDFSARKEDSSGSHSVLMSGDGAGGIDADDLSNLYFEIETAYTGTTTALKPIRILFNSSTASHSKSNNPPITSVGIQGVTTGAGLASAIKTALEGAAGQYTDQLTTDGGTNFTDAFTITVGTGINSSLGNAKLTFTAKEKGFAGNNETPSFSTSFAGKTPFFEVFAGGLDKSCKSAGDKLQDLIGYVGNATLGVGAVGRALGGPSDPDDPNSLVEANFSLATKQSADYIIGLQLPYNSLITSSSANDDYVERNMMIMTGRTNAYEQGSEANTLSVSSVFDPTNPKTGITGTVVAMSFSYNAGENVYEGDLTFMPIDFMTGI